MSRKLVSVTNVFLQVVIMSSLLRIYEKTSYNNASVCHYYDILAANMAEAIIHI